MTAPVHITSSNGGTVGIATAGQRPIETLLSGPASGVAAAARVAAEAKVQCVVTLDMGGTSADIAICRDRAPEITTETRIGHEPLILPVVDVWSIGAGGGSVVWTDPQGALKVGPNSAGAEPGPVCYAMGGAEPTVTDCYVALGYIDPAQFLGGRKQLDRDAAWSALAKLGGDLGFSGDDAPARAAAAALRVATARMATEIAKGVAQRGLDIADFALMPFGGAGPTHANLLAEESGLDTIMVPPSPGTFCALGAIMAPVRRDFVQSSRRTLGVDADAADRLRQVIADLERAASDWVASESTVVADAGFHVSVDMQYPRTASELRIDLPERVVRGGDAAAFAELFHRAHERLYGFRDDNSPVDVTTLRLTVRGAATAVTLPMLERSVEAPIERTTRRVFHADAWHQAGVYRRADLRQGHRLAGPAVIEQEDSTILLLPGWQGTVDGIGGLHIDRRVAVMAEGEAA